MKKILLLAISASILACKTDTKVVAQSTKKENTVKPVVAASKKADTSNMVKFDGGTIQIGSERTILERGGGVVTVAPFYIDKNLVTVAEFREFIKATGYKTEAENYGDSGVFNFDIVNWQLVKGTTWEFPFGPAGEKAKDNHPVTHVSWNDAKAYASWAGKRLPYEFEWEFAAKNGQDVIFPWGNEERPNGKFMANVWEGGKITDRVFNDGYQFTSPVGSFPQSLGGLYDMVGNVWQWCEDVFGPYNDEKGFRKDPNIRVTRGGSFMFDDALSSSYTTTFRAQNTVDTSLFNCGFRCALSAE